MTSDERELSAQWEAEPTRPGPASDPTGTDGVLGGEALAFEPFSSGARLFVGRPDGCLEAARWMLERQMPFVVVTRTLPAAVRLRDVLDPARLNDESGAPLPEQQEGRVALVRSHSPIRQRRQRVEGLAQGTLSGLIVTADDLESAGALEHLLRAPNASWLVQDAQAISACSPELRCCLRALRGLRISDSGEVGTVRSLWLFAEAASAAVIASLQADFEIDSDRTRTWPLTLPTNVELVLERRSQVLETRDALRQALQEQLGASGFARGVVVAPLQSAGTSGGLPVSELLSVAQEVGASPVRDPGEDADARTLAWARLHRGLEGLLLTDEAEALQILPPGSPSAMIRLVPPLAPEVIAHECWELACRGGGRWAFLGEGAFQAPLQLRIERLEKLARWLLDIPPGPEGWRVLDVEQVCRSWPEASGESVQVLAPQLEAALEEFTAVDWISGLRRVRFQLEVADAHGFASPHIDADPRYVDLKARYDLALSQMGMAQAVRNQLSSRPPKDLREFSSFLHLPVAELNVLFDDLARDGIMVCRQVTSGTSSWNRNFEICLGEPGVLLEGLAAALTAVSARRAQLASDREQVWALLEAGGDVRVTLLQALSRREAADLEALERRWPPQSVSSMPVRPPVAARQLMGGELPPSPAAGAAVDVVGETHLEPGTPAGEAPSAHAKDRDPAAELVRIARSAGVSGDASLDASLDALLDALVQGLASLVSRSAAAADALAASALRQLEPGGESAGERLASLLLWIQQGEIDRAARHLADWLTADPAAWRETGEVALVRLLAVLDYRFEQAGRPDCAPPSDLIRLAHLLPVLEPLAATVQEALLQEATGLSAVLSRVELGVVDVVLGGQTWRLVRQPLDPEVEATLWLAVRPLAGEHLPMEVIGARLAEAYDMVAGIGDPRLSSVLEQGVLEQIERPIWLPESRRRAILGRALLSAGRTDEAQPYLEKPRELPVDPQLQVASRVRAQLEAGELLGALQSLQSHHTAHSGRAGARRGELASLWGQTLLRLQEACQTQVSCESCTLRASDFCPDGDALWRFLEANPFDERRRALRVRLEKRVASGDMPPDLATFRTWVERLGCLGSDTQMQGWLEGTGLSGGRLAPAAGLSLARLLAAQQAQTSAAAVLGGTDLSGPLDAEVRVDLARLFAQVGALGTALELLLETEAGLTLPRLRAELTRVLGEGWEDAPERWPSSLAEGLHARLLHLIERQRLEREVQQARKTLEDAVRGGAWRGVSSLQDALKGALLAVGQSEEGDASLDAAAGMLAERRQKVVARAREILAKPEEIPARRGLLERLREEAGLLGEGELAAELARSLEAAPTKPVGSDATGGGRQRREEPESHGEPRPARSSDRRPAPGMERGAARAAHRADPAQGAPRDGRRGERGLRAGAVEGGARPAAEPPSSPEELRGSLERLKTDRERLHVLMPVLERVFQEEAERGIKLVRDLEAAFGRADALDRPLAELVRRGTPADEALPRLKRVLEKIQAGTPYRQTLDAINDRLNPEPWKALLSQLKLGR